MNNLRLNVIVIIGISIIIYGCSDTVSKSINSISPKSGQFSEYWYQGKAELNRYQLEQVRYGETHNGEAVLIYVTEDFLSDKQVKYERGPHNTNVKSVLKLNFTRQFYTGIYPYSLMTSIFYPVNNQNGHALKISSSSQEWCGHTYMQVNQRKDKLEISLNSYFQSEGDRHTVIDPVLLEDEIWTKIRINPDALPEGNIQIVPGLQYLRLLHQQFSAKAASAVKEELFDKRLSAKRLINYQIQYKDLPRKLSIIFEKEFPHSILSWEEEIKPLAINGKSDGLMISRAKRTNMLMLDYWNKNSVADSTYKVLLQDR